HGQFSVCPLQAAGSEQEGPGGEPVDIRSPSDSPAERCCCGASLLGSQGTCSGPAAGSGDGEPRLVSSVATGEFLPPEALKEMKANLIKFLPFKYLAKELTSQAEILKKVLRDNQEHFPVVFSQASHCLELVCGVEVKEVDPREHIYIMVPNLGLTCDVMLSSGQSMPKAGLLVLILSLIMQNGDRAPEEKVWGALSRLGVCVGSVHCVFGEPRTLLTHVWVQEGYLEYRQVPYSYPARYEFLWGPRAYAETSKREVMAFLLRIKERASRAFPPLSAEAAREEDELLGAEAEVAASASASSLTVSSVATGEFLPPEALKEMKANLIKFLPFKYLAKELTSQAEILKKVLRDNQEHFPVVFSQASHCLELVCGVEVKEVDPREHIYIMVPNLGLTCDVMLSSGQSMPKAGLLVLILSLIMQNGDRAPEEKVWGALSRLGVCVGSVHCVFGEPRTLLTHVWVQEGYLEYRQVPYSYPARYEFLWGPRAYAETSKREVMAFLLRIKERASRAFPPLSAEAAREEDEAA
ncbi:unnamed protein product, partial [Rangifer tarandus platyrhynchus]